MRFLLKHLSDSFKALTVLLPALEGQIASFQTCAYIIFNNLATETAEVCFNDMVGGFSGILIGKCDHLSQGTTGLGNLFTTCGTNEAICFSPGNEFFIE